MANNPKRIIQLDNGTLGVDDANTWLPTEHLGDGFALKVRVSDFAISILILETDTLDPGENATVTQNASTGHVGLTFGIPRGLTGNQGIPGNNGTAANITINHTFPIAANGTPAVTNVGNDTVALIDFYLPIAPTFNVNGTTTLLPGNNATVVDVGTDGNISLDFGIPSGSGGNGALPGGFNTCVQYNDGANGFAGSAAFRWDDDILQLQIGDAAGSGTTFDFADVHVNDNSSFSGMAIQSFGPAFILMRDTSSSTNNQTVEMYKYGAKWKFTSNDDDSTAEIFLFFEMDSVTGQFNFMNKIGIDATKLQAVIVPGTISQAIELYDEAGTLIGYIPLLDSIS